MANSNVMNNQGVAMNSSQTISIVPETGEQFNPGQKIIYNIEPEVGYIKRDSYLVFDVVNNSGNHALYTFAKNAGCSSIIESINIYSKETGILLENLNNYAEWVNIENQYLYDDATQLQLKEGVGHPVQAKEIKIKADNSLIIEPSKPVGDHPANNQLSPKDITGNLKPMARRFCLRLRSGIFNYWDDEKLIPILNFGGLRIELVLAKPELALQRVCPHLLATPAVGYESGHREIDLVNIVAPTADAPGLVITAKTDTAGAGNANNVEIDISALNAVFPNCFPSSQEDEGVAGTGALGLAVGNVVNFYQTATTNKRGGDHTITSITFSVPSSVNGVKGCNKVVLGFANGSLNGNGIVATDYIKLASAFNVPNYKVKSTEFRLLQVVPPPNVANALMKGLNYEFTSYDTFLNNIPTGVLRHQIPITSVASKAVALFTHYHDATKVEDHSAPNIYDGLSPSEFALNSVQYFINNRLYPLRDYNPQARSDRCLNQNELVKAWRAIGKNPLNLGDNSRMSLNGYANSYMTCRELARQGFVFDLRNAEPEIRLKFSGSRASIVRANTFVFSKKIIQSTATGVQVVL